MEAQELDEARQRELMIIYMSPRHKDSKRLASLLMMLEMHCTEDEPLRLVLLREHLRLTKLRLTKLRLTKLRLTKLGMQGSRTKTRGSLAGASVWIDTDTGNPNITQRLAYSTLELDTKDESTAGSRSLNAWHIAR